MFSILDKIPYSILIVIAVFMIGKIDYAQEWNNNQAN